MSIGDRRCPKCGSHLDIELSMKVTNPMPALPGMQPKILGQWAPVLVCTNRVCIFECWGVIEGREAVFPVPDEM